MLAYDKQIIKNLISNIASFAINFVISFLLTPYLIKTVGKEAYSFFPLVNSIIGYSSIITAAVGSMAGRFITIKIYQNDNDSANKLFNSIWVANLILSILFSIVALVFIFFIDKILVIPQHLVKDVQLLFGLGSFSLILGILTGIFGIGTFVHNRLDSLASRTAIADISKVIVIIILFCLFKPTIAYMGVGAFSSAILLAIFNLKFKERFLSCLTFSPQKNFSFFHLKEVLFSGIWNSINQLSNILLQQADLLMANLFIGVSATGDYSIVKTAPLFIYSILAVLSGAFIPHFNILFAKNKFDELVQEIKKSMTIVGLLVGLPIGFLLVYSNNFYNLWVPSENNQLLFKLTFVTLLPMIFGGSINPIFGVFTTTNKLRIPSLVLLLTGILNTIVTIILLAKTNLGLWAIAIVGAVQSGLRNLIFTPIYGAKCLNQKWCIFYPTILKGSLGMLIVSLTSLAVKCILPCSTWIQLFLSFCIVITISFCINFFIVLSPKEILKTIKQIRFHQ